MQGKIPPDVNQRQADLKHIGTIFDSDSEEEIYSQPTSKLKWNENLHTLRIRTDTVQTSYVDF